MLLDHLRTGQLLERDDRIEDALLPSGVTASPLTMVTPRCMVSMISRAISSI
jgi:hypothetical protein